MPFEHLEYAHDLVKHYRHDQCQRCRARRCSLDAARRAWYAHYRMIRLARRLLFLAA